MCSLLCVSVVVIADVVVVAVVVVVVVVVVNRLYATLSRWRVDI